MKPGIQKRFAFIGKSLLWSAMLYIALMLAFNWDEVSNTINGKNAITVVSNNQQPSQFQGSSTPANITARTTVFKSIVSLMKTITGIAGIAARS